MAKVNSINIKTSNDSYEKLELGDNGSFEEGTDRIVDTLIMNNQCYVEMETEPGNPISKVMYPVRVSSNINEIGQIKLADGTELRHTVSEMFPGTVNDIEIIVDDVINILYRNSKRGTVVKLDMEFRDSATRSIINPDSVTTHTELMNSVIGLEGTKFTIRGMGSTWIRVVVSKEGYGTRSKEIIVNVSDNINGPILDIEEAIPASPLNNTASATMTNRALFEYEDKIFLMNIVDTPSSNINRYFVYDKISKTWDEGEISENLLSVNYTTAFNHNNIQYLLSPNGLMEFNPTNGIIEKVTDIGVEWSSISGRVDWRYHDGILYVKDDRGLLSYHLDTGEIETITTVTTPGQIIMCKGEFYVCMASNVTLRKYDREIGNWVIIPVEHITNTTHMYVYQDNLYLTNGRLNWVLGPDGNVVRLGDFTTSTTMLSSRPIVANNGDGVYIIKERFDCIKYRPHLEPNNPWYND